MYVLQRTDQGGGYVARSGSGSSYTHKLELARKYPTEQAAQADCCPENERVINVDDLLGR